MKFGIWHMENLKVYRGWISTMLLNNLVLENGDNIRNINIYSSVISAGGVNRNFSKPNINIGQNVSKAI